MGEWPTRMTESGALALALRGKLNIRAAEPLREQLNNLVTQGSTRVVVDLSGVDDIDSSGVGALIFGLKTARHSGGDLRLAAPNKQIRAVLSLTNLDTVFKTYDTADEAFAEPV